MIVLGMDHEQSLKVIKNGMVIIMSENLGFAFEIMGKGMFSIFVVIILLMAIVTLIPRVSNYFDKSNKNKAE